MSNSSGDNLELAGLARYDIKVGRNEQVSEPGVGFVDYDLAGETFVAQVREFPEASSPVLFTLDVIATTEQISLQDLYDRECVPEEQRPCVDLSQIVPYSILAISSAASQDFETAPEPDEFLAPKLLYWDALLANDGKVFLYGYFKVVYGTSR